METVTLRATRRTIYVTEAMVSIFSDLPFVVVYFDDMLKFSESIEQHPDYLKIVFDRLRILTGKKHPKIKLQRLRKIRLWTFGSLVHQINYF